MYVYIHIHTYIYIYICKTSIYIYIYIYTCTHVASHLLVWILLIDLCACVYFARSLLCAG